MLAVHWANRIVVATSRLMREKIVMMETRSPGTVVARDVSPKVQVRLISTQVSAVMESQGTENNVRQRRPMVLLIRSNFLK